MEQARKGSLSAIAFGLLVVLLWVGHSLGAAKEVIELKLAQMHPAQAHVSQATQKMLDMIHEKAGGRLKITAYYGETLLKQTEHYRATQLGVVDIAYFGPSIPGSPVLLGRIISLPFLGLTSNEMVTGVYSDLFKESPELQAEYKGLKVLGIFGLPMDNLHLTKRQVRIPQDVKGMKILTMGARAEILEEAGAAPVTIPHGDWYTSLERGLAEGVLFHFPFLVAYKLLDLFKHHTVINACSGVNMWIFNEKKWNSLPPDLQKIISDCIDWRVKEMLKYDQNEEKAAIEYAKTKGHTVYYPTPDEMRLWQEATKNIHTKWIQEMEAKGFPAKKVYERLQRTIERHQR